MYTAFFGLQRDPFTIAPDPRFLFLSERHREALAHLRYGSQGTGGFVLLTGDIGTGKTTVCRRFLVRAPSQCQVAYIFNPRLSAAELLHSIHDEFGLGAPGDGSRAPTIKEWVDSLNRFLLQVHAQGRSAILIIDEAQNLDADVLEQLRLLTNLETHERKLLQIVLIGQPELRDLLARPELEQLAQRVVARFHLGALEDVEISCYLEHRLGVAGWRGPLPFSAAALRRIRHHTGGVPRRINLLCGRALLGAYAKGTREVDARTVDQAAREVFATEPGAHRQAPWRWALGGAAITAALGIAGFALWRPVLSPAAVGASATQVVATAAPTDHGKAPLPTPAAAGAQPSAAVVPLAPSTTTTGEPADTPTAAAQLLADEADGWKALAAVWQLPADEADTCAAALARQLQCYRMPRMTWHGLRQMDRPAFLRLRLADGTGYALLEAMDDSHAALRAGERRWIVDSEHLQRIWQGEYFALWRRPPGHSGYLTNGLNNATAPWLAAQLAALQGRGELDPKAIGLREQVSAFQRSRGLPDNGRASPTTLMILNRAVGVDEPRLATLQP